MALIKSSNYYSDEFIIITTQSIFEKRLLLKLLSNRFECYHDLSAADSKKEFIADMDWHLCFGKNRLLFYFMSGVAGKEYNSFSSFMQNFHENCDFLDGFIRGKDDT